MICKPCEEKFAVCFAQSLSELNANVLHYGNLLLSIRRGVCPCEYEGISSYAPWVFPGEAAFNPGCILYKCKPSTLPPPCPFLLIYPSPASCQLSSSLVLIKLASSQPTSVWTKDLGKGCICRKSVSKLNFIALCGFLFSLP